MFVELTEKLYGYATYGYWKWHNTEEAVKDCDENVRGTAVWAAVSLPTPLS
jgi:hypothetical protein